MAESTDFLPANNNYFFSPLFRSIPSMIIVISASSGDTANATTNAIDFLGYSREEIYSMNISDVIYLPDQDLLEALTETSRTSNGKIRVSLQSNKMKQIVLRCTLISCPEEDLLVIDMKDVSIKSDLKSKQSQLKMALAKAKEDIKALGGFIPVCSHCKKIRDDEGYWNLFEKYFLDHSIQFSHGICPDCTDELYPDLDDL
ncbi:MAG: PAS domain-containing protein [Candidatus Kariarchaeaceae archaeon]